jgi:hypothetical protein
MKFRGHETFYIRKGWLYKGISKVTVDASVFMGNSGNPMDIFGIGSNMVKSLRYWLQAVGLTEENSKGKRSQHLTEFGRLVKLKDEYFQEVGTLWLVHYKLVTNLDLATSWYIFFNQFDYIEFTKEDFVNRVTKYLRMNDDVKELPATRTIEEDFNCIVNTYLPKVKLNRKKVNPESNLECPLAELGLLDVANKDKKIYRKARPSEGSIPPLVVLAVILDNAEGNGEIPLTRLLNDDGNVGKVFNLDTIRLVNIVYELEKLGYLKVVRTAGLDIIKLITDMSFLQCVEEYYNSLG